MTIPTKKQIDDVLNQCDAAIDKGGKYPGLTFEEGVKETILWLRGSGVNPMGDDYDDA